MSKAIIYYDPPKVQLTLFQGGKVNLPLYQRKINIFRNVNNSIEFNLRDCDRQPVKIFNRNFSVIIVNPYNQELMATKYLEPVNERNGVYSLTLTPGDVQDWSAGFYDFSVIYQDPYGNDQMFYTDLDQNVIGTFELIDKPMPTFIPSTLIETGDWTQVQSYSNLSNNPPQPPYFITSNIAGDAQKNTVDGDQTFSVLVNNYTGTLYLQGSLENTPISEKSWFDVPLNGTSGLIFSNTTGIGYVNVSGNYLWMRFVQIPGIGTTGTGNTGIIERIWFRN